jgi:hypothetical protein
MLNNDGLVRLGHDSSPHDRRRARRRPGNRVVRRGERPGPSRSGRRVRAGRGAGPRHRIARHLARARADLADRPGPQLRLPLGRACFAVWDHWLGAWKGINLYHCRTYTLSDWLGNGDFSNNQTGGAAVILYGQQGQVLGSYPPNGSRSYYSVNWNEVWKIKPC